MAILSLDQIKDKSNKDIFVTNWGQWLYLQVLLGKAPMIKWNKLVWFWIIIYAVILKDNATINQNPKPSYCIRDRKVRSEGKKRNLVNNDSASEYDINIIMLFKTASWLPHREKISYVKLNSIAKIQFGTNVRDYLPKLNCKVELECFNFVKNLDCREWSEGKTRNLVNNVLLQNMM
jgi:hypothetical protein